MGERKELFVLKGARQVVQVVDDGSPFLKGPGPIKSLAVMEAKSNNTQGLSVVMNKSTGLIVDLGDDDSIAKLYPQSQVLLDLSDSPRCVIPGLIDGHTHPVWDGDRVHEFAMKLAGASYMDVHKAGGGINFTVDKTRAASHQQLEDLLLSRLNRMLQSGTTTVECKSGYGLNVETEVKMLKVLETVRARTPIEISSTFCGAHSIPKGSSADVATADVITKQLPAVTQLNASGQLHVENIDVFCETGVFNVEQTERILKAGKAAGLRINFHGEELSCLGSAEMGGRIGAEAISHLEEVSEAGMEAMAKAGTTAVILPTTAYILRLPPPPVRKMMDKGVIVALGTDFNPNAFCLSMPLVMHLACVNLRMSLEEALAAATINAAHSLGRSKTHGSIERGKVADLVVVAAPRWEHLVYQLGGHDQLVEVVIKKAEVVHMQKRK